MANPENKSAFRRGLEKVNYEWSKLTWRIGLISIPFLALTGSPIGAIVGGAAYLWDRRSIIDYENEHNIPKPEGKGGFLSFLDPSRARGSQRLNLG